MEYELSVELFEFGDCALESNFDEPTDVYQVGQFTLNLDSLSMYLLTDKDEDDKNEGPIYKLMFNYLSKEEGYDLTVNSRVCLYVIDEEKPFCTFTGFITSKSDKSLFTAELKMSEYFAHKETVDAFLETFKAEFTKNPLMPEDDTWTDIAEVPLPSSTLHWKPISHEWSDKVKAMQTKSAIAVKGGVLCLTEYVEFIADAVLEDRGDGTYEIIK